MSWLGEKISWLSAKLSPSRETRRKLDAAACKAKSLANRFLMTWFDECPKGGDAAGVPAAIAKPEELKKAISKGKENPICSINKSRIDSVSKDLRNNAQGVAGDPLQEGVPQLVPTYTEKEIAGNNNTSIILGRDRRSTRYTGYGGAGHTQAGAIDIVVGRGSWKARSCEKDQLAWVNPDFEKDAARIYISQKSDVDKYFQIAQGSIGDSEARSSITVKADALRLVGREGIKLVTKTDAKNSQGGDVNSVLGIDIIAGNDDSDLQPLAKGDNLVEALNKIITHIDKLNGIVDSILMAQNRMNLALTTHFHFSPFFALPTTPSPPVVAAGVSTMMDHLINGKRSLITHKMNLQNCRQTYLSVSGGKYINSRFNNVN